MLSSLIAGCFKFSWWIDLPIISAALFGEYPYPEETD